MRNIDQKSWKSIEKKLKIDLNYEKKNVENYRNLEKNWTEIRKKLLKIIKNQKNEQKIDKNLEGMFKNRWKMALNHKK